MSKAWLICLFLVLAGLTFGLFLFCHHKNERNEEQVEPVLAFYHWKTAYRPGTFEKNMLEQSQAARIYMRLFDVGASGNAELVPIARSIITEKPSLPVTPVVYIDNQALKSVSTDKVSNYAEKISKLILELLGKNGISHTGEVQFDCDWTASTKEKFFLLLNEVRRGFPKDWKLSSTLRLFQYRYPDKAGIPSVDRVVLMVYNMGNLREYGDIDSILDPELTAAYLDAKSYPLPLDVALPLFNWGVLFDRQNRYRGLIRNVPEDMLGKLVFKSEISSVAESDGHEVKLPAWEQVGKQSLRLLLPCELDGVRVPASWSLRIEGPSPEKLQQTVKLLQKHIKNVGTVIFYHLDENTLKGWDANFLRELSGMLR